MYSITTALLVVEVLEDAHNAAVLHLLEERKLLSEQGHGLLISVFPERLDRHDSAARRLGTARRYFAHSQIDRAVVAFPSRRMTW